MEPYHYILGDSVFCLLGPGRSGGVRSFGWEGQLLDAHGLRKECEQGGENIFGKHFAALFRSRNENTWTRNYSSISRNKTVYLSLFYVRGLINRCGGLTIRSAKLGIELFTFVLVSLLLLFLLLLSPRPRGLTQTHMRIGGTHTNTRQHKYSCSSNKNNGRSDGLWRGAVGIGRGYSRFSVWRFLFCRFVLAALLWPLLLSLAFLSLCAFRPFALFYIWRIRMVGKQGAGGVELGWAG